MSQARRQKRADGGNTGDYYPPMSVAQVEQNLPATARKGLAADNDPSATNTFYTVKNTDTVPYPRHKPLPPVDPKAKPLYAGYAKGGRTGYAIGGEVLPDVLSVVGDVVGSFFGDPGAGNQGTSLLSALDGGKTGTFNLKKGGLVPQHLDTGGPVDGEVSLGHNSGLFNSLGAGRTDIHNRDVPPGGYVVPADVVSGLAEGNTMAGSAIIDRMMKSGPDGVQPGTGPQGMKLTKGRGHADFPRFPPQPNLHAPRTPQGGLENIAADGGFKKGGLTGKPKSRAPVPVVVAGGEHYVNPNDLIRKFGNLKRAHAIMDAWVVARRKQTIDEMKKLPPPKR